MLYLSRLLYQAVKAPHCSIFGFLLCSKAKGRQELRGGLGSGLGFIALLDVPGGQWEKLNLRLPWPIPTLC